MGRRQKWLSKWDIVAVRCPRCWAKPDVMCGNSRTFHPERLDYALKIHGKRPLN